MGNYIYCGDKIFIKYGLIKQEYVSLDDKSMTKVCLDKDNVITTLFKQENNVYDIGQDSFELLQYDENICEVGFSNELIRGLKREFQELNEFHVQDKDKYLLDEVKSRKRGI